MTGMGSWKRCRSPTRARISGTVKGIEDIVEALDTGRETQGHARLAHRSQRDDPGLLWNRTARTDAASRCPWPTVSCTWAGQIGRGVGQPGLPVSTSLLYRWLPRHGGGADGWRLRERLAALLGLYAPFVPRFPFGKSALSICGCRPRPP